MTQQTRSSDLHKLLREKGKRTVYYKGQIVQSTEGQRTLNLVTSGFVKRYLISNTGNLGVEVIYGNGDIFPLTLMFNALFDQDIYEGPEVYFYEAMGETKICTIDINILAKAVAENPMLYKYLLAESGRRLHTTLNSLENLALKSTYNRVAHQLTYFAREFGQQLKSGIKIPIPLTSQDLADVLSLETNNVGACLSKLQDKGFIKNDRFIIVTEIEKLEEEAHK
jgi:CRP-like cAMP-binding protein